MLGGTTLPKYKPPPGHRQGQYVAPTPPPPINFAHRTPVLGGDPNLNELLEKARSEPKGNRPKPVPKAAASSPIRPKIVPRVN